MEEHSKPQQGLLDVAAFPPSSQGASSSEGSLLSPGFPGRGFRRISRPVPSLSRITPELKAGVRVRMGLTPQRRSPPPPRARGQRLFSHCLSILHSSSGCTQTEERRWSGRSYREKASLQKRTKGKEQEQEALSMMCSRERKEL